MQPNTSLEKLSCALEPSRPPNGACMPYPPTPTADPWEPEAEEPGLPLSHYLWVFRRHRWKIAAFILVSTISTLIVSSRLVPIYESTVTVDVDRRVPTGIIGQDAAESPLNDADQFLATQLKLVQSDAVLRPVAEQYHLRELEHASLPPNSIRAAESPVTLRQLKVTRPPNTYLLLISYRSPDAVLAANVANGIAQSYVEHTFDIRFRSSASLSTFMEKQLEELKAKMERSSAAQMQFERELNVISPGEKNNILSSRLLQLNTDYTAAQSDRLRKEAAFRSVGTGSLEAAQASPQGEQLKRIGERLDEAQEKFAGIAAHYGPNHPEYRKARIQLDEVKDQLDGARRSVGRRAEAEYREAENREKMLAVAVNQTKNEFDRLNARSFEYDALKHEAEADKKLYEELITKIREAGINAGFQSSTVRIADNARPGVKPVFPNIPLNVGLALLFSTTLAAGATILSDKLDNTVRDTEQVYRLAKVQVIAGLPRVKFWKDHAPIARLVPAEHSGQLGLTRHSEDERTLTGFEEAIRTLRNTILLGSFDRRIKSLMLTSATPGEGKSTIATHLAVAHAQQKHKTLLIDCDLRRPTIDKRFGMTANLGLSEVLLKGLDWRAAVMPVPDTPNLDVLLCGQSSRRATDLIGRVLPQILEEAAAEYDLAVVDAPPALGFPEPLQMATAVDGVALVALAGETDRKALLSVVTTMKRLRANVIGVVLNEVTRDGGDSYYYHGYYGKYSRYYQKQTGEVG
jgi:succinoglycan biosynthesis transport protein ExoP